MAIKVSVKWGKQKYDNLELNPAEPPLTFKAQLFALTGVPPHRQKLMAKGGVVKDDAWAPGAVVNGMTMMLVGSADEAPVEPPPEAQPAAAAADAVALQQALAGAQEAAAATVPPGLVNLGNTCYLNSTLQVLHALPELRHALRTFRPQPQPAESQQQQQSLALAVQLRELFSQLDAAGQRAVGPLLFVQLFRTVFPQFAQRSKASATYAQQDAEECWSALVNALGARLPALPPSASTQAPAPAAAPSPFRSAIEQLFSGELATSYTCLEEPAEGAAAAVPKREPFLKLACNIGSTTNFLLDGLRDALKEELVKRSDRLGRDARHQKVSQIARLPYCLTVQFVRFFWRSDKELKAKILRPVEFPLVLDLFDFATDELKARLQPTRKALHDAEEERIKRLAPGEKKTPAAGARAEAEEAASRPESWVNETGRYELCGVVTHRGRSADGGHYVGWVRQAADRWLKFDDEEVSTTNDDEVRKLSGKGGADSHIAYLLLYRTVKGL